MFNLSPLFPGDSDIDQLQRVFTWLGTPRTEDWPEVNDLPDYKKIVFSEYGGRSLGELIPSAPPAALDLIHGCLSLNPSKRLSAEEVRIGFEVEVLLLFLFVVTPMCVCLSLAVLLILFL